MYGRAILRVLAMALFVPGVSAAEGMTTSDVASIFQRYESLNSAFVSAVGGPSEAALRQKAEAYSAGPFEEALDSAVRIICRTEDVEILRALFRVTLATSNSASESPAWSLGRVFACRPVLVAMEFRAVAHAQQRPLYEMLRFGFENAVYDRREEQEVAELRAQLDLLAPPVEK